MDDQNGMALSSAQSDMQLEVDILMLDYLLYTTNMALLREREKLLEGKRPSLEETRSIETSIDAIDATLGIFKHRYSADVFDQTLMFRLELLKLSIQFCYRLVNVATTPSTADLRDLRYVHRQRSNEWRKARQGDPDIAIMGKSSCQLPLPRERLDHCRSRYLTIIAHPVSTHYGSEACMSLVDILPHFLLLTARRTQLNADFFIRDQLMDLAAEFMLQASLEACLCFGRSAAAVSEAFAWGFISGDNRVEDGGVWEGEAIVNKMFTAIPLDEGTDGLNDLHEIEGWDDIRAEYLSKLRAEDSADLSDHLLKVAAQYPVVDFETRIISYLEALAMSIELPVLVQLEQGQLTEMSVEETDAFKRKVGLMAWTRPI